MTDSESDMGIIHLRNRLLELMYSSEAVLSVDQIARILAVDESRIVHELKRVSQHDVLYDPIAGTVRVQAQRPSDAGVSAELTDGPHSLLAGAASVKAHAAAAGGAAVAAGAVEGTVALKNAEGGGNGSGLRYTGGSHYVRYGSDGGHYFQSRGGRAVATKSALRKTKYRRPVGAEAVGGVVSAGEDESTSPKGRVGYVCVADEFRLSELEVYYRSQGFYTKFDFDVLHIRFSDKEMSAKSARGTTSGTTTTSHGSGGRGTDNTSSGANNGNTNTGNNMGGDNTVEWKPTTAVNHPRKAGFDLFVFEYGAIVWWGFDQRFFKIVENDFMLPNSPIARYMVNRYMTQLVSENYPVWCTYTLTRKETLEPDEHFRERLRFDHFIIPYGRGDFDTGNVSMLCASHALAQSAKIDYLELKVQELAESCSPLPRELREKGRATITERRLLQLRGEVLSYRLMLKSGSNLMDEPDFFWENAYLKPVFQATKECFEIAERVEALDNKLDAANEILSMLAEEFSQRHGARLEWIVIWLVFAEVVIGVLELLIDLKPWFYRKV
ncbi:uncharacterized protein TM35_000301190 [Trypanosoma theileri]|uniref:DUF155 domain-containing protein n=1 Tax=Trypanosoma theileri TaxID=67003 RepID=A0A1X0NPG6_9TRYP|nr:uncharacterized protein TM35_000301190 [Trypanosoma theileri]ORC86079.1 hypothetical protein TM35_000301190 [Trypanosoma theileri]